jgi:oligopeptide transport system substrate-binding protein
VTKRIAAWILAATMAIGVLAGCGSTSSTGTETKTGENTQTTTEAKPAAEQVLTFNIGEEPPGLDSATTTDAVSFDVLNQVMEGLVRVKEGGIIEKGSGQAADWTISDDGTVYTFTLKDGLKWSDGQPVTSKDFAYAWFRALDPNTASEYNYQLFYIKGAEAWSTLDLKASDFQTKYEALKKEVAIETPDDKTIKVTLNHPTPYFLGLMNFPTYFPQRQDVVEKFGEKFAAEAANMVFNGPFVITSWQHEAELVLEKNPNYWDANTVKLEKVIYKMIKDSNTAINMFEANQLDSVGLPGQYIPQYKDKPGFSSYPDSVVWYLQFNMGNAETKKYLQNEHIRTALSLAVDRQQFVDAVLRNGSAAATGIVPGTININGKSYRDQVGPILKTTADPAAAQAELAKGLQELGLDKLPPMDFLTGQSDVAKKYAQGVQGMIQQNLPGVTVNIVPVEFKVRLERMKNGEFDIVLAGWGADYDDPATFFDLFLTGGPQNDSKYSNPEYDRLVKGAAGEPDQAKRLEMYKQAEQILMKDLPIAPLYIPTVNRIRKPWVKGVQTFTVGAGSDLKFAYVEAH